MSIVLNADPLLNATLRLVDQKRMASDAVDGCGPKWKEGDFVIHFRKLRELLKEKVRFLYGDNSSKAKENLH